MQREMSLLGPVLSHTVKHSATAASLWDDLPSTLISKQTADIINNLDKTRELVSIYQSKVG